jgi:hypothetical protein
VRWLAFLTATGCAPEASAPADEPDRCEPADEIGTWYRDADGDGWGNPNGIRFTRTCDPPDGYVARSGDCADAHPDWNPDAVDPCQIDLYDIDCDGTPTWYVDRDGDGYGTQLATCDEPAAPYSADCDDTDVGRNPGLEEVCGDGIDQDCTGDALGCGLEPDRGFSAHLAANPLGARDVTGDGTIDLLGDGHVLAVYRGPFDRTTSRDTPPLLVLEGSVGYVGDGLLADLDGDGTAEALAAERPVEGASSLWTDADALFGVRTLADATHVAHGVAWPQLAVDTDGDGADEIVAAIERQGLVSVSLLAPLPPGESAASDLVVADLPGPVASGDDIDGDGLGDIVWVSDDGVGVDFGPVRGPQTWADADLAIAGVASGSQTRATAAGDLDGDGSADLAASVTGARRRDHCGETPAGAVYVLLAPIPTDLLDADASFTATGVRIVRGGTGDFDADGDPELLLGVEGCDTAGLHVVTGPFAGASDLDAATMARYRLEYVPDVAFTADFNDNGFDDVALLGASVTWLLFGGPGM